MSEARVQLLRGPVRRKGTAKLYAVDRVRREDGTSVKHFIATGTADKAEALAIISRWNHQRISPSLHPTRTTTTIGTSIVAHLERLQGQCVRGKLSAASVKIARQKLGHVVRVLGAKRQVNTIDAKLLESYTTRRTEEGAAALSVTRELSAVSKWLKAARRLGDLLVDPRDIMPEWSGQYVPRDVWITQAEAERLWEALPVKRKPMFAFIIAAAARLSEVYRSRVGDVDLQAGTIAVDGSKTEASRGIVRIPITSVTGVWAQRAVEGLPRAGKAYPRWIQCYRDLELYARKVGIGKHITPTDLRRSVCTWLILEGVEQALVSRFMRHSSEAMVRKTYGRPGASDLGHLIERSLQRNVLPCPTSRQTASSFSGDQSGDQTPVETHGSTVEEPF